MAITLSSSSAILLPSLCSHITNQSAMPPRSSCSRKKSNKQLKKDHNKHFASQQPNHYSSPALEIIHPFIHSLIPHLPCLPISHSSLWYLRFYVFDCYALIILCFNKSLSHSCSFLFLCCFYFKYAGLGELDPNIFREQNGRNGNFLVRPSSDKCQFLVVEEEKKRGFSVTAGLNEMEGSVEETQKVVESQSEDKQVVGFDEEKVKTIVESDAAEVVAETQVAEEEEEEQDSNTVEQKEEEESSPLVEPEKVEDASELIVDDVKVLESELKQKANQEEDSQEAEPPSEQTNEPSSVVETETSREAEADKLDSSEEKKESSSIETDKALRISESSVPETDVASRAIEETKPIVEPEESGETPILKPEESGETKLPDEEQKVKESIVVKESSKEEEEAKESLPPSDVATAETTSTTMQEKAEMPTSTESQQTTVNPAPREHASWSSCCGIFDFLFR